MSGPQSIEAPAPPAGADAVERLRLGVVTNRLSTRNRKSADEIHRVLSRHPTVPHVEIDDWSRMPDALAELMRRDPDAIVVNGGDGTVIGVLTELRRKVAQGQRMPALIVLASGNTNMIAGDVGPAGPPRRALAGILETASSRGMFARTERRMIRLEAPGEAVQYGFFVGAVAVVRAIQLARRTLHPLGVNHGIGNAAGIGLNVARLLLGGGEGLLSGIWVDLGFEEEPLRHANCAAFMATTLRRMIFGVHPFWGAEPGPLRATVVHAPVHRPMRSLVPLLRGRPTTRMLQNGYESRNVHRLRISIDGPIAIDGEYRQARSDRPITLSDGGSVEFIACRS